MIHPKNENIVCLLLPSVGTQVRDPRFEFLQPGNKCAQKSLSDVLQFCIQACRCL